MQTVNKGELVVKLAQRLNVTQVAARDMLDAFTAVITGELKQGNEVSISGFGKFSVTTRAARNGTNPHTKTPIQIPETRLPKFKAGAHLKDAVA